MKEYNIAQFGSFDVKNYGDLLFPIVLRYQLSKYINIKNLILFSPTTKVKPFTENEMVYSINDLEELNQKYNFDVFVIGGGDLIRLDKKVLNDYEDNYKASMLMWKLPILFAKKNNIPIIFNSPGVPFRFEKEAPVVKQILEGIKYITVRDKEAKNNLTLTKIKNIEVITDTVVTIDQVYPKKELSKKLLELEDQGVLPKLKKYIAFQHNVFNLDNDEYINKIIELLKFITENQQLDVILVPIGYVHKDIDFLGKLVCNDKVHLIRQELSPYDMLAVFACSSGFIGTSLHGVVTSSTYGVPIMAINPQNFSKVKGYLRQIDKTNVEVNNINELLMIYKNNFDKKYNNKINERKKEVNNHFKKVASMISDNAIANKDKMIESKIYNEMYKIINDSVYMENTFESFKVYFGKDKNSFSEENAKIYTYHKRKDLLFATIIIPNEYKSIRIDPIEGYYVKIRNLSILNNGKKVKYYIPKMVERNNTQYFYSKDPQILVEFSECLENNIIKIEFSMEKIGYEEMESIFNYVEDKYNKRINDMILKNRKKRNRLSRMIKRAGDLILISTTKK